ncbi:MAG: TerB family tellurite resistance protein [Leptolyngbyaceae cyanobacterium T60_A2020_046]|nr:TerB family tellurite resistance protein [Leptolyngbyaceae cyanobacterium T60_A2020_046]
MAIQTPPPPPSISPRQMALMRVVASMAWSDGNLATEEVDLMLDRFTGLFAQNPEHQAKLRQELRDYLMQNLPLEETVPQLNTLEEREMVLRLGYEVISSSARTEDEALINNEEADAYSRLVALLNLPPDVVARVEAEADVATRDRPVVEVITAQLQKFFEG